MWLMTQLLTFEWW